MSADPGAAGAGWLRLLYVSNSLNLGGAERMLIALAKALRARGAAVEVVAEWGPLADQLGDVPYTDAPIDTQYPWNTNFARKVRRGAEVVAERAAAIRANVLFCDGLMMALIGRLAARRLGVHAPPVLAYLHGFSHRPYYWAAPRALAAAADRIITVCHYERRRLMLHGVDGARVDVVHNFVDVGLYRRADRARLRQELGLSDGQPLAGFLGRFAEQKQPGHFIWAAAELARRLPDARFVMAGTGPLEAEARDLAASYGLRGKLHLLGFRKDIPAICAALDLLLLPSVWELLPVALLEAMAAGVPTVAYAVGGVPEVIWDGETGYLVARDDLDALVDRSAFVLSDPARREALGAGATRRCAERFDVPRAVDRLLELFAAAARRPSAPLPAATGG